MIQGQVTLADMVHEDHKHKPKPTWIVIPKGHIWCPYCNWVHRFKYDSRLGVYRCSSCGISERDYFVKKFNKMGEFYEVPIKHTRC